MQWYRKVTADITELPNAINHFENEYREATKFLVTKGQSVSEKSGKLPSVVDKYFEQLQEVEAILNYLNIELEKTKAHVFKKYLESYQRALSSRDCEQYAKGDQAFVDMKMLVNEFSLVRNKYLSLHKGLDSMGWMIGHVVRLKCAGLDDVTF